MHTSLWAFLSSWRRVHFSSLASTSQTQTFLGCFNCTSNDHPMNPPSTHTETHAHTHIHTHTHTHTYTQKQKHTHTQTHTDTHRHTQTHTDTQTRTHTPSPFVSHSKLARAEVCSVCGGGFCVGALDGYNNIDIGRVRRPLHMGGSRRRAGALPVLSAMAHTDRHADTPTQIPTQTHPHKQTHTDTDTDTQTHSHALITGVCCNRWQSHCHHPHVGTACAGACESAACGAGDATPSGTSSDDCAHGVAQTPSHQLCLCYTCVCISMCVCSIPM